MLCPVLLIIGIMGYILDYDTASWVIIVMIYIWAVIYQLSIGATGFVLASEVATMRLRAATQALVTIINGVWGLIMQFTIPYMIEFDAVDLGGKAGFIFFATGSITAIAGYFLFPETKVRLTFLFAMELYSTWSTNTELFQGITFEKLDELYAAGVQPRKFKEAAARDSSGGITSILHEKLVHVDKINDNEV